MIIISSIFLLLVLAFSPDSTAGNGDVLKIGEMAPMFYAKQIDGGDFFLSKKVGPKATAGKKSPVLLSFFSTTCIPCRKEIAFLHSIQKEFPSVDFYLIDISEPEDKVKAYVSAMNWTIPILIDRWGANAKKYKASSTPTLIIISEDGTVFFYKRGYDEKFNDTVKKYLQKLEKGKETKVPN